MKSNVELASRVTVFSAQEMTPKEAADYVRASWQDAVESIIETGRRLIEAKAKVKHGQWLDAVALMPFSEQTAQKLMQIANHPDLPNAAHVRYLPAAWGTLAVLAQLPEGEIPKLIEQKQITPELERSTAQEWVKLYQASQQEALNAWSQFCDCLSGIESYINSMVPPVIIPDNYQPINAIKRRFKKVAQTIQQWEPTDE